MMNMDLRRTEGFQNGLRGETAATPPGNGLEMQTLVSHPRCTEPETLVLNKLSHVLGENHHLDSGAIQGRTLAF